MFVDIISLIILLVTIQIWGPIATLYGIFKLLFTLSISAAWEAWKSVPGWIWDFVHSVF